MSGRSLTPEENERVLAAVRDLLAGGETQTSLAPKLGVTQSALSSLLARRHAAGYAFARKLARLLRSDIDALLSGLPRENTESPESAPPTIPVPPRVEVVPRAVGHDLGVLEKALFGAMDSDLHEAVDFDVAREVIRLAYRFFPTEISAQAIAEQLLASARSLREDNLEVSPVSVLARSHPVDGTARSATRRKVVLGASS